MELIPWLVAGYALICVAAYFGNRHFMYHPNPVRIAPAEAGLAYVSEVDILTPDGVTLVAWHAPARDGKPTVLYFHGNASNAANRASKIETMHAQGHGVFYLNNRGYGGSGGSPTEAKNVADAITAFDYLTGHLGMPADKVAVYGESLGTGQAVRLGAERPVAAVILEAPLTSTIDVGRQVYFWLPLNLLLTDKYDNERNISEVKAPVLILHGAQDEVIPVEMGKRVYDAANQPKRIEIFPQAAHYDLFAHGAWDRARDFLDQSRN
jgi:fermentation-respiration switch protein FrsA (DUF1100 family)